MNSNRSHVVGSQQAAMIDLTIGQLLSNAATNAPDKEAIVSCHQQIRLSYGELDRHASEFAEGLLQLGLKPGDRIGIWSPNNIEWVITLFAAARAGLILVNVNPAYRPLELKYALNKVGCRAIVMADRFKTSDYPQMLQRLAPELVAGNGRNLNSAELPELRTLILISDAPRDGFLAFDEVASLGKDVAERHQLDGGNPSDPVNIQFTSGTTGAPKGATLTHFNIVNNGWFVGRGQALTDEDRMCVPVPLYHCFGMVMGVLTCVSHGATFVMPADAFDPLKTLQAVQDESCTSLYGVPTMFSAILDCPEFGRFTIDSLRTGVVAGSLCPAVLMERILADLGMTEVTNCYGMTETSPVSFQTAIDDAFDKRTTTVGRIHPHVEVKITDGNGEIVPIGQRGELCTRGYSVMQGYWADDAKTAESIVDGWMLTGDEAVLDEEGYCAIVGRIKDTIIRGGENIAPKEIEEYLLTHSDIMEVQAFGIPDERFGEIVCVWIRKKVESQLDEEGVTAFCRDEIAHFKVPAHVRFVDEFPMTVTGKVQKYVMRDAMLSELSA